MCRRRLRSKHTGFHFKPLQTQDAQCVYMLDMFSKKNWSTSELFVASLYPVRHVVACLIGIWWVNTWIMDQTESALWFQVDICAQSQEISSRGSWETPWLGRYDENMHQSRKGMFPFCFWIMFMLHDQSWGQLFLEQRWPQVHPGKTRSGAYHT